MAQRLKVLEEAHRETHWAAALVGPELLEFKGSADSVEMKQVLKCSAKAALWPNTLNSKVGPSFQG